MKEVRSFTTGGSELFTLASRISQLEKATGINLNALRTEAAQRAPTGQDKVVALTEATRAMVMRAPARTSIR